MSDSWYAWYPGDYGRDTAHLTLIEHGAYRILLDHYYIHDGFSVQSTNVDVLYRICRAFDDDEKAAVRNIVDQFFVEMDGKLHHKRADAELLKKKEISEKRRKAVQVRYHGAKKEDDKNTTKEGTSAGTNEPTNVEQMNTQPQPHKKKEERGNKFSNENSLPLSSSPSIPQEQKKEEEEEKFYDDWLEFRKVYPGKGNVATGYREYCARRNEGASKDHLLQAAEAYASHVKAQGTSEQYTMTHIRFLREQWQDYQRIAKEEMKREEKAAEIGVHRYHADEIAGEEEHPEAEAITPLVQEEIAKDERFGRLSLLKIGKKKIHISCPKNAQFTWRYQREQDIERRIREAGHEVKKVQFINRVN